MRSKQMMAVLLLACALTVMPCARLAAQAAPAAAPGTSANNKAIYDAYYSDVEAQRTENARRLAEIDQQHEEALAAYRDENIRRAQTLSDQNIEAQKQLAEQGLQGDAREAEHERLQAEDRQRRLAYAEWRDATARQIQQEFVNARSAQLEHHNREVERLLVRRNSTLEGLMNRPVQPGAFGPGGDTTGASGDANQDPGNDNEAVSKSDLTTRDLYREHCALCHGYSPGTRQSRYDLYEAVVVDDAAYFLNRVRNGPGPMPRTDAIQALSDAQVYSIRDWIREEGDINTGVVASDEPEKSPDTQPASSGPVVAGSAPPGLPPVTRQAHLPGSPTGASTAAIDAATQSLGVADLTCNVQNAVGVSLIAPFAWDAGWIPPGGTMNETGETWDDAWMLRLRARLEDPAVTDSGGHPAPGWCTYTEGSLGSTAGKAREISIVAHTHGWPFGEFEFSNGNVSVWLGNQPTIGWAHSTDYVISVIRAVHGTYLRSGTRQANSSGEVHAHVKRIDDRWSNSGNPVFLVVD